MMKTIYATSLYLLITCLTSVIGADIAPIENTQFKLCFYVSNLGPYDPLTVNEACEQQWLISPNVNGQIQLYDPNSESDFCVRGNVDEVVIDYCDPSDVEQQFNFNSDNGQITRVLEGDCLAVEDDEINVGPTTCISGDQSQNWFLS